MTFRRLTRRVIMAKYDLNHMFSRSAIGQSFGIGKKSLLNCVKRSSEDMEVTRSVILNISKSGKRLYSLK